MHFLRTVNQPSKTPLRLVTLVLPRRAVRGVSLGANSKSLLYCRYYTEDMERETGFEPATSTLARSHSTTELFPRLARRYRNRAERRASTRRNRGTRTP